MVWLAMHGRVENGMLLKNVTSRAKAQAHVAIYRNEFQSSIITPVECISLKCQKEYYFVAVNCLLSIIQQTLRKYS